MDKFKYKERPTSTKMNKMVDEVNANTEGVRSLAKNFEGLHKTLYDPEVGNIPTIEKDIKTVQENVDELQLYKFPNVTIKGDLTINHGQVSGFAREKYLVLPFALDLAGKGWELNLAFTTGENVTTAQNIIGSNFCLAMYVQNGQLTTRISTSGNSWEISKTSSFAIEANKTYYVRLTHNLLQYAMEYSTDGKAYTNDWNEVNPNSPSEGLVYMGVGMNYNNPFGGIINLNKCSLLINNQHYWEGMDDAGLATRLATDLSNIDQEGVERIKELAEVNNLHTLSQKVGNLNELKTQDKSTIVNAINEIATSGVPAPDLEARVQIANINARQGAYPSMPDIPLSLDVSGKVISTDGAIVNKTGYGISKPVQVQKGNTYRFPSSEAIGGHALFAQVLTRDVQYTITMQSYGDDHQRIERISTTRGIGGIGRVYRCVYSGENDTIVGIWQDSAEDGYSTQTLPVVGNKTYAILNPKMLDGTPMTSQSLYTDITSATGGQVAIRPSYTEYSPSFNPNDVVMRTANGEYVIVTSWDGLMVVSGNLSDLEGTDKVLYQSRDGKDASFMNQISQMLITNTKQELTEQQKAQGRENLGAAAAYVESELNEKAWKRDLGFIAGQSNMLIWEDIYGKIHIESGAFKSRKAQQDNVFATTGKRLIAGNISNNSGEIAFLFGIQTTKTNWEEIIPQLIVTDKCTSLQYALSCLQHVKDLSFVKYWDTKNVVTISGCFNQCTADEIDVSSWDLTSMVSLGDGTFSTFGGIKKIIGLDKWDTSNVTAMGAAFSGSQLEEIPVSEWNTSSVTTMTAMFYNAAKVINLDLHKWDTSLVKSFNNFIYGCLRLTNLDIRGLNCSSMTSGYILSHGNPLLTNILGGSQSLNEQTFVGMKISQTVNPAIDYPSARAILNGIATIEDGSKPVLTFVASTYNRLTDADFALADSKGWQIAKG